MSKRGPSTPKGSEASAGASSRAQGADPKTRDDRVARLLRMIDLCGEAKSLADGIDASLLAYLLAMAIQEARTELRDTPR